MIAVALQPWLAISVGATTLGVYGVLHFRKLDEQDASVLALLAGAVVLLVLQTLEAL